MTVTAWRPPVFWVVMPQNPGRTRTGIKITDPARHETTDINFPGLTPSPADMDMPARRSRRWMPHGSWPGAAFRRALMPQFIVTSSARSRRGARVVLDTSGDALRHGVEAAPDIIKPNIHELEAPANLSNHNPPVRPRKNSSVGNWTRRRVNGRGRCLLRFANGDRSGSVRQNLKSKAR